MNAALDAVATADRMADLANELLGIEVARARSDGATWDQIADRLGRSRQAVQKRFGVRIAEADRDAVHPGKGYATRGALQSREIPMKCVVCGDLKPGSRFPTVRRQQPGGPVRETRCRECREAGRTASTIRDG
jgi:hypothetical protein